MTDIIDQANDVAQQSIERAIANAPKFNRPSLTECKDCGEIHRHTGGLEIIRQCLRRHQKIHRHTGGLEKQKDSQRLGYPIHRHTGGLET